jgi:phosphatidylcholine synthase
MTPRIVPPRVGPLGLAGYAVHVLTASGAAAGLLALLAAFDLRLAPMFAWLGLALAIDAIDGPLARAVQIEKTQPEIDGVLLDLVVDYLTYVVVPVVALARSALLPPAVSLPLCLAIVVASALYFADRRMKTSDLWFRGFPAIWNVLVFVLVAFAMPPLVNACVVFVALVGMFAPVAFVHPVRVRCWRVATAVVTALSAVAALDLVVSDFAPALWPRAILAICVIYYLGLSAMRGFRE